ncbi:MAG: sigma-70 family RNA polymerase sigma factor [Pirellula sp.]
MTVSNQRIRDVIQKAQNGDAQSLGELLAVYRGYLIGIAVAKLDPRLRARCNPSDIVQETMLEAFRDFPQFRGELEREFLAWIRQILANNLARAVQTHLLANKRDVRREKQIGAASSGSRLEKQENWIAGKDASPSSVLQKKELLHNVLNRVAKLPPHYRDVLVLRHIEEMPFEEIATRLGKSSGAVRMIWLRALESLREFNE